MKCIFCLETDPKKKLRHPHLYMFFKNFFIDQGIVQDTHLSLWTFLGKLKRGFAAALFTNKVSYHESSYANIVNTKVRTC